MSKPKSHLMRVCLAICLIMTAPSIAASTVYWGGVSFSDWQNRDAKFPNLASMMCSTDCSAGHLNSWALEMLGQSDFEHFDVSMDYIDGRQIEGVIMTPMINSEATSVYQDITGDSVAYIHVYRIYASLVFFEFGSKRFIGAKPIVIQYTDTRKEPASSDTREKVFKSLVSPGESQSNLFAELFNLGSNVKPFSFSQKYARISEVSLAGDAAEALESVSNHQAWSDQIQRQFESFLINATEAPLVPSMGSDDMTSEFVATFADASVTISMPQEVAYDINLHIENFRKIEQPQRRQKTLCHAVAMRLQVRGLLSELFNERLVRGRESCSVVTIDKDPDDSYYFTLSLLSLLKKTADQFSDDPDKEFISNTIKASPEAHESFINTWRVAFKPEL